MESLMNGILYIVGVGPGDPELITLKAFRTIQSADVIASPSKGKSPDPGIAYQIARQIVPNLEGKETLFLHFPMSGDDISSEYRTAAAAIREKLDAGKTVAYLTLGDPGFYSTIYQFVDSIICNGYSVEIISGVPSFCAASSRIRIPLAKRKESVLITTGDLTEFTGTQVIMKAGTHLRELKEKLRSQRRSAVLIENCGMSTERIFDNIDLFPDETGYFSMIIVQQIPT